MIQRMRYDREFMKILQHILNSLDIAGYDADRQIVAYALTGDEDYITRYGEARTWIHKLDIEQLREYYGIVKRRK